MATIKAQNNQRNASNDGWDVIHHETEASIVLMADGTTSVETKISNLDSGVAAKLDSSSQSAIAGKIYAYKNIGGSL
ncbi:MAG: hypothetical protein HY818_05480 [Acetobacterium woodii]|nr:hypothetical protein [Acetobacterium woodii]